MLTKIPSKIHTGFTQITLQSFPINTHLIHSQITVKKPIKTLQNTNPQLSSKLFSKKLPQALHQNLSELELNPAQPVEWKREQKKFKDGGEENMWQKKKKTCDRRRRKA